VFAEASFAWDSLIDDGGAEGCGWWEGGERGQGGGGEGG
jgi:hypothetical protein